MGHAFGRELRDRREILQKSVPDQPVDMTTKIIWTDENGMQREVILETEDFPPLIPKVPAGKSQRSQKSQARFASHNLDTVALDLFEERAAIIEFDAGLNRAVAEARAILLVLAGRRN